MEVVVNDQASSSIPGNQDGPLVAVTFTKKPKSQKYLEGEPKALGVTQICLSIFQISTLLGFHMVIGYYSSFGAIFQIIGSLFVIIAGSVALAAQSLHLPTIKACLGMQVVAAVMSVINVLSSAGVVGDFPLCLPSDYNETVNNESCSNLSSGTEHYLAEILLSNVAAVAISVTLAAYCCKTVNCCTPRTKMPVITINAPLAQQ